MACNMQLVDDKSIASCQQTCCKLIVKTLLSTGLLQVVSTVDKLQQAGKMDNLEQVCGIFGHAKGIDIIKDIGMYKIINES